jgi:hypothetical protein
MGDLTHPRLAMTPMVRVLPVLLPLALLASPVVQHPLQAQQQGYGQTMQGAGAGQGAGALGPGMGKGNSVLDAVNPIDLMNRIRRSQALDDATPPGDAVDQALRDYATQTGPAGASATGTVKGP